VQILAHVSPSPKQLNKQDTSSEEKASEYVEVPANTNVIVLGELLQSGADMSIYSRNSATVTGGPRSSKSKRYFKS